MVGVAAEARRVTASKERGNRRTRNPSTAAVVAGAEAGAEAAVVAVHAAAIGTTSAAVTGAAEAAVMEEFERVCAESRLYYGFS